MTLTERIARTDRRDTDLTPIVERRGGTERRIPEWLRRKEEAGLPPKDMTGTVAA